MQEIDLVEDTTRREARLPALDGERSGTVQERITFDKAPMLFERAAVIRDRAVAVPVSGETAARAFFPILEFDEPFRAR